MAADNRQTAPKSLKNKILASMILTPSRCLSSCWLWWATTFLQTSLEKEISSRMVRIADDHRRGIELFLSERVADLKLVSEIYTFKELSRPEKLARVFEHLKSVSSAYVDLGVFDRQGMHVSYAGPLPACREAIWRHPLVPKGPRPRNLCKRRVPGVPPGAAFHCGPKKPARVNGPGYCGQP